MGTLSCISGSVVPWGDVAQLGGLLEAPPFVTVSGGRASLGAGSVAGPWLMPGQSLGWVVLPIRCS